MSLFPEPLLGHIRKELERYETRRSAILPVLHLIQDHFGWIQDAHVLAMESEFALPRVWVEEVLTFYSMYRKEPSKPYRIYVCNNIVCTMMGANQTMAAFSKKIEALEAASQDATCKFSLEGVPCLGVCDGAPAVLINKDRHLRVDPAKALDLIQHYHACPS
jgi:NADH:ubiquinone oxidoreductase subunit E